MHTDLPKKESAAASAQTKKRGFFSKRAELDLTNGPLFSSIVRFAIPILLANLVTTLFSAADMFVLSLFSKGNEIASVGATSSVVSLFANFAIGLCSGVNIILARLIGQGDEKNVRRVVSTSILTAATMGLLLALVGTLFGRGALVMMNCPEECLSDATLYLQIYFIGAPALLLGQYGAAILRVSGDSKRPLYYMLASGAANVLLNTVFCLFMERKVVAVALATLLSQVLSAVLSLARLAKTNGICRWEIKSTRFDFGALKKILLYGFPTALTTALFPLTNVQVQSAINSFGPAAIAGNTAAIQYESIVGTAGGAIQSAALAFIGQNLGARRKERVFLSFLYSSILSVAITASLAFSIYAFKEPLLSIFVAADAASVAQGAIRLKYVSLFFILSNIPLAAAIQAFGHPTLQTVINVASVLGLRTLWMQVFYPMNPTLDMLYICYPISYVVNTLVYAPITIVLFRRLKNDKISYKL